MSAVKVTATVQNCLCVCVCVSLSLSFSLSLFVSLCLCLSVSLSVCLCLSVCLSVSLMQSPSPPPPYPPLFPSLRSLVVSVDVKHHVYLLYAYLPIGQNTSLLILLSVAFRSHVLDMPSLAVTRLTVVSRDRSES